MEFSSKIVLAIGFVLIAGSLSSGSGIGQETEITVIVYNTVHVPQPMLSVAEREAASIFRKVDIAIVWVDCPSAFPEAGRICHNALSPRAFVIRIVPRTTRSTDAVFGEAFLPESGVGKSADLFFDRVESVKYDSNVNPARLLGAVAAHELGHLLLGTHAHTPFGIMAPRWQGNELRLIGMGVLGFNSDQAARMRSRILDLHEPQEMPELARKAASQ